MGASVHFGRDMQLTCPKQVDAWGFTKSLQMHTNNAFPRLLHTPDTYKFMAFNSTPLQKMFLRPLYGPPSSDRDTFVRQTPFPY